MKYQKRNIIVDSIVEEVIRRSHLTCTIDDWNFKIIFCHEFGKGYEVEFPDGMPTGKRVSAGMWAREKLKELTWKHL